VFEHDVPHLPQVRRPQWRFARSSAAPTLAREALEALGVAFERLQIAKAHDPPSQQSFDLGPAFDGLDPSYPD
jgi:hypothetical protein